MLPRDQRVLLFGVSGEFGWGVVVVLVGGGVTLVWCVEAKWPVNFGCLCGRTQRAGVRGVCIIAPKASVYILAVWSGACTFEVVVKAFVAVYPFV